VVLIDSVRRVAVRGAGRRARSSDQRKLGSHRPVAPTDRRTGPSLQPGQLRRTRPDLPLIDAVDGPSDFIACPTPGCCAVRPVVGAATCPICGH
jgi:hypothetical protein